MIKNTIKEWTLVCKYGKYSCKVPCSYYGVLLENGKIEDPYYRTNEKKIADMFGDDCRFETVFSVDKDVLLRANQELVFEGIDTLSTVYLNGATLAKTDNMHRTWRFDVTGLLHEGENSLVVDIASPVTYFEEKNRLHPMKGNGDTMPGFAHLRKAFYMMGWDWGPTLPDMGIWRSVYLCSYDVRIDDVEIRQIHRKDGSVLLRCITGATGEGELSLRVTVTAPDGKVYTGNRFENVTEIEIEAPELWWPNGYGEHPLYDVTVSLYDGEKEIDRVVKQIGLRTITISQDKDEWGQEFCFIVNGVKIFSMGANVIPEENILSRRSREKTEYLVRQCVEANFNTLRVWGGGHYPEDWFYELCDKNGLIVWQDFMFACNLVWMTENFEANVKQELIDNLKRIRHHASLGLLCGNNENESFMVSYMRSSSMELERADYLRLYCHLIPDVCDKLAPDIFYWSSSPSSGTPLFEPDSDSMGDCHYWKVWGGLSEIERYKSCFTRFCSEFGFQSLPDYETVEGYTLPEDRNFFSVVMNSHQKNRNGNGKLMYYMSQYYAYPTNLRKVIYATQLLQERAISTAVEHFRRNRGRCMGALYWQLNDCWPVASWSAIDYEGRPKALYYATKRFFAPVLVSANVEEKTVSLHVVNERMSAFSGKVSWSLKDTSFNVIVKGSASAEIPALKAKCVFEIAKSELPKERMCDCFLEFELTDESGDIVSHNTALLVKPREFAFKKPNVVCRLKKLEGDRYSCTVSSDSFARRVKLSFEGIDTKEVSEQYFDITSRDPISITLTACGKELTEEAIEAAVSVLTEADLVLIYE